MLDQPEYLHVVLNHLPLIGLLVSALTLLVALISRNRTAILIGLGLVSLLALSAWPVYHYGEEGYDRVLSMSDDAGGKHLGHHRQLAERWIFLYFITAGVAALGFLAAWKWPRSLLFTALLALAFAAASLAAGVVIAKAGGAVRHREFRRAPPPSSTSFSGISYWIDGAANISDKAGTDL